MQHVLWIRRLPTTIGRLGTVASLSSPVRTPVTHGSSIVATAYPASRYMSTSDPNGPPAATGCQTKTVDTPALLLDLDGTAHKCPEVAARQMLMLGAQGVCCQKVCEALAMAQGGITDIFVSNEVVAEAKIQRLAALLAKGCAVSVCVDDTRNLRALAKAGAALDLPGGHGGFAVLVEVNVGQDRCGVNTTDEAVRLAELAHELSPGVMFRGIQAYNGAIQHVRDPGDRAAAAAKVAEQAHRVVMDLERAGFKCPVVTGGGTGTFLADAASGVFTEVQPGSFCFGDVDYARNRPQQGEQPEWQQALWVASQVISRNPARRSVVVDAGMKAVSMDSGAPIVKPGADGTNWEYQPAGDEHGILLAAEVWQAGSAPLPELGSTTWLQPGHCDPTVNMYDWLVAYRGSVVEDVWQITGRGPGR